MTNLRLIVTMSGMLVALTLIMLIHGSVASENVRNNEIQDALEASIERAVKTIVSDQELSGVSIDMTGNTYIKPDGSAFELKGNRYENFLLAEVKKSGTRYAIGICYNKSSIKIIDKGSFYELEAEKDGNAMCFSVPLEQLPELDLSSAMSEITFSCGEAIISVDAFLYSNIMLYESASHDILLNKNLLNKKESLLLKNVYSEILNAIDTDSKLSCKVIDADYNQGRLDLFIEGVFQYPNGREGIVSCRKSIQGL